MRNAGKAGLGNGGRRFFLGKRIVAQNKKEGFELCLRYKLPKGVECKSRVEIKGLIFCRGEGDCPMIRIIDKERENKGLKRE